MLNFFDFFDMLLEYVESIDIFAKRVEFLGDFTHMGLFKGKW